MVTIYVLNAKICLNKEPETADRIGSAPEAKRESVCYLEICAIVPRGIPDGAAAA
jgi:hypothetical protein